MVQIGRPSGSFCDEPKGPRPFPKDISSVLSKRFPGFPGTERNQILEPFAWRFKCGRHCMSPEKDARRALESFVVNNRELDELEHHLDKFDIFEAVGVVRQELMG